LSWPARRSTSPIAAQRRRTVDTFVPALARATEAAVSGRPGPA
jgi:hypothetical protein